MENDYIIEEICTRGGKSHPKISYLLYLVVELGKPGVTPGSFVCL